MRGPNPLLILVFHLNSRQITSFSFARKVFYWGEHQRAPQSGVELEICHSRYIYISIVGWSPSFEPAPGAAPAGLVASRDSEALPRKGPLSLHVSPAKYMTSGRIKFPKLAHFSSAKYNSNNTSGRIGFLYTFSMHAQTS